MLEHLVVIVFLQVSGPAATAPAPAAKEPEMVCTMEPVTGTRARKQKVCKPKGGFAEGSETAKRILDEVHRQGGNWQPKPAG
jgi:hypothetical protein